MIIVGVGGCLPFQPEISIRSMVDPDMDESGAGNGCVLPRGALSSIAQGAAYFLCFSAISWQTFPVLAAEALSVAVGELTPVAQSHP